MAGSARECLGSTRECSGLSSGHSKALVLPKNSQRPVATRTLYIIFSGGCLSRQLPIHRPWRPICFVSLINSCNGAGFAVRIRRRKLDAECPVPRNQILCKGSTCSCGREAAAEFFPIDRLSSSRCSAPSGRDSSRTLAEASGAGGGYGQKGSRGVENA